MDNDKNVMVPMEGESLEKSIVIETKKPDAVQKIIPILVFACVFVLVLGGASWAYLKFTNTENRMISDASVPAETMTPKVEPLPLPAGPRTFMMSHGKDVVGPKMQVIKVSTIVPEMNAMQKINVTIKHDSRITDVAVNLMTDTKISRHELVKVSGTDMDGAWEGEWVVDDTYDTRYFMEFDIKSETTSYKDGLAFR